MTMVRARWNALADRLFARFLGAGLTGGVTQFLKQLGTVTICFAIARVLSAVAGILAARALGKTEFGHSQLVLSVAQLFSLVGIFGLNSAVVRYGSGDKNPGPVIATAFWSSLGLTGVMFLFGFLFRSFFAHALDISQRMYLWGLTMSVLFALTTLTGSIQQTAAKFTARGMAEILLAVVILCSLVGMIRLGVRDFTGPSTAYIIGYSAVSIFGIYTVGRFLSPAQVTRAELVRMLEYAFYSLVCSVGFVVTHSFQRFILNALLSADDVGIYSLYTTGSLAIAVFAGSMISTVLFPKASASTNRAGIWTVFTRLWSWAWLPLVVMFAALQIVIVFLSGKEYPVLPLLAILLGVASAIIVVHSSLAQIIVAEGPRGVRLTMIMLIGLGLKTVLFSYLLVPHMNLNGAALAVVIAYALQIVWMFAVRKEYV